MEEKEEKVEGEKRKVEMEKVEDEDCSKKFLLSCLSFCFWFSSFQKGEKQKRKENQEALEENLLQKVESGTEMEKTQDLWFSKAFVVNISIDSYIEIHQQERAEGQELSFSLLLLRDKQLRKRQIVLVLQGWSYLMEILVL